MIFVAQPTQWRFKLTSSTKDELAKIMANTKTYRWIGNHVQDFEADGRIIMAGPGDFVNLTENDLKNYQELVDNNLLIESAGGGNYGDS